MKEITRIHIAKTAYDIELAAKKELETYMTALERYAGDQSILDDIEIRITELLEENGTTKDDVITADDVAKLRERLGEPQDFAEDSDVAALPADAEAKPRHRLYRNHDQAVLGGVLSGIATYFGINPLWTRLAFIVLLLGSFGTMAIVYVVLWLALPAARTAAEKLELEGKPVTLAALKGRSDVDTSRNYRTAEGVQRALLFCLGLLFSVVAATTLLATIVIGAHLLLGIGSTDTSAFAGMLADPTWQYVLAFSLFVVSGLLFAALNVILAVAAFRRAWTKRIGISVAAIVVGGILAFSSGVGTMMYGTWEMRENVRRSMVTDTTKLPAAFTKTRSLTIDASHIPSAGRPAVVYMVSDTAPRYELSYPSKQKPTLQLTQEGSAATITATAFDYTPWYSYDDEPVVRVYGPALDSLTVKGGTVKYETKQAQPQAAISFTATNTGTIMAEGSYDSVTAHTGQRSEVYLFNASVRSLQAKTNGGSIVAGVVRNLDITQPETCPSSISSDENSMTVAGVSGGEIRYNGKRQSGVDARDITTACGSVTIGDREE